MILVHSRDKQGDNEQVQVFRKYATFSLAKHLANLIRENMTVKVYEINVRDCTIKEVVL